MPKNITMSSLQRYKKSGGFFQLLSLIETFGVQKREKFLEMIDGESPAWARALREKMLSLERIFTWPDQVVVEVFKRMPPKSQAFALEGLKDDQKAKVMPFFSPSEQRRLTDVLTESKPKPEEVQAVLVKLVEVARKCIQDREIHPEKFDPVLMIPDDFENKIETQYHVAGATTPYAKSDTGASITAAKPEPEQGANLKYDIPAPAASEAANAEVYQLQRTLAGVLKENKSLKEEVKGLQSRLDQIKKIA